MVVTATGTWEILALDKADTVAVSGTAFPILVPFGSIGYGVRGKTYLLDEDLIALEVVEIDQLPVEITKAARYRIAAALALTKAGRYRLVGPVSLSKGGTYRLATAIAPTKAAAYRIVMVSDPVKTGRYRLLKPVTPSLKAVYAIAVKWDQAGLAWDSTPIFWDGAAASQLLNSWDAATPLVWDTAGVRWDE